MRIINSNLIFYKFIFIAEFTLLISSEKNDNELTCSELSSTSLNINCIFENEIISCDEPMLNGTKATLKCKEDYYIESMPYNEILCDNGQWNLPLFNCIFTKCPELFSTSLDINCVFENKTILCDEPMPDNTTVTLKCKDHYYIDSLPFSEIICEKGQWSLPLFNCEPICGFRTPKGTPLVVRGLKAEIGDFPWHVSLFEKVNWNTRRYICGGSIISPKLVLTAAHCFQKIEPRRYDVTAGKYYREWSNTEDQSAEIRDVTEIIVSKKYDGQLTSFTADIAILVMDRVFTLSDLIHPVCIDFNMKTFDNYTDIIGEVPGWGLTSEGGELSEFLQYTKLPLISREECLKSVPEDFTLFVTFDKICAGFTNGTSVCEGDSGGGLVHRRENNKNRIKYYIIGIVSTSPFKEDSCDSYRYSTFTNVANHIVWMNETKFKYELWSPYDYGCPLPDPPSFGTYIIIGNMSDSKESKPGNIVPHYTKLKYSCIEGYEIYGSEIITCKDKKWNDNIIFPACYRTCSDLVPPEFISSDIYIRYSSEKQNNGGFSHETRAFFDCIDKQNFELEEPKYNQTTCRDGKWIKPILKCVPICGVNNIQNTNDEIVEKKIEGYSIDTYIEDIYYEGKYPWYAGIYKKIDNNYKFKAHAAILSPFVLIINKYSKLNDSLDDYVVVMGNSQFSMNNTSNKNIQMTPIFKIIELKETIYYSYYTTLIVIKKRLNITSFVRPVCLDQKYILENKGFGEIPVWVDGNDKLKNLKFHTKKFCNEESCNIRNRNRSFIDLNPGHMVKLVKVGSKIKHYIMNEVINRLDDGIFVKLLDNINVDLIQKTLKEYDIESNIMSECIVPNISRHGHILEYPLNVGQTVLETSKITFTCDLQHYELNNVKEMICRNSSWISLDGVPPTCIECGISDHQFDSINDDIASKGLTTEPKDFPWNVGIYDKQKKIPQLICSGTILSSKIVLSVASCLPNVKYYTKKNKFAVGAGKIYQDWNNTLDVHAQYVDVDNIIYFGLFNERAILVLAKHLSINSFVTPLCLNTDTSSENLQVSVTMPFWINDSNNSMENKAELKYLKFNLDKERYPLLENSLFYCPNNEYWKQNLGSAAIQILSNRDKRYFLHSTLIEANCENGQYMFGNVEFYKEIVDTFIKRYNK